MVDKKVSKLARATFIVPALLWGTGLVLCRLAGPLTNPVPSSGLRGFMADLGVELLVSVIPISLVLGIMAIRRIRKYPQELAGTYLAIGGMLLGIVLMVVTMWVFLKIRFISEAIGLSIGIR